jgi:hypothetical protein
MENHDGKISVFERRRRIIASASADDLPVTENTVQQVSTGVGNTPISPSNETSDKGTGQESTPATTKESDTMTPDVARDRASSRGAAVEIEDAVSNTAEAKGFVEAAAEVTESQSPTARSGEPGLVIHTLAKNMPVVLRGNDRIEDIISLPKHAVSSVYLTAKGNRDRDLIRNDRDGRYAITPLCVTTESQIKPGSYDNTGIISNAIDEKGRLDGTLAALKMGLRQSEVPRVSAAVAGYTDGDSHLAPIFHLISLIFGGQVPKTITPDVLMA